jgi:heat shock protein HslJ
MTIHRPGLAATALFALSACAGSGVAPGGIAGSTWELVEFQSSDDAQGTTRPAPGQRYSVTFGVHGSASFQLNCNRGSARWTAAPAAGSGALTFGPVAMTRAFCPQPSLDTRLAQHLEFVRSYIIRDGVLSMSLMADGGVYR